MKWTYYVGRAYFKVTKFIFCGTRVNETGFMIFMIILLINSVMNSFMIFALILMPVTLIYRGRLSNEVGREADFKVQCFFKLMFT